MTVDKDWFELWFDSPYYHILYRDRDTSEAQQFIDRLMHYLQPQPDATILDLACGNGRHAIYLAEKGFEVTGIDLSEENINRAQLSEHDKLRFYRHDIRNYFRVNYFNYVFNFFTSFGYFDREQDNLKTLRAANWGLKQGGTLVIDFLNAHKVAQNLISKEEKVINNISFCIKRKMENGFIVKTIDVDDNGTMHHYKERVQGLTLEDFERYFTATGFQLRATFGDYHLGEYNPGNSDRLILVASKIND